MSRFVILGTAHAVPVESIVKITRTGMGDTCSLSIMLADGTAWTCDSPESVERVVALLNGDDFGRIKLVEPKPAVHAASRGVW